LLGAIATAMVLVTSLGVAPAGVAKAAAIPVVLALSAGHRLVDHPFERLGPANRLTLLRAVLIAAMAAFVGDPTAQVASPWLVLAGGIAFGMDWLDGRVARATGSASAFGARLDEELDAITVVVLGALAWGLGRAGAWILLAGAARYLYLAAGWVWPWMSRSLPHAPRRAWACGVSVTALLGALAPWPGAALSAAVAVAAVAGSFGIDIAWLWRRRADPA